MLSSMEQKDQDSDKQLDRKKPRLKCLVCQSRTKRREIASLEQLRTAKQDGCKICTIIYDGIIALDPSTSERQQEWIIDWHEKLAYHLKGAPLPLSVSKFDGVPPSWATTASDLNLVPKMRLEFYTHSEKHPMYSTFGKAGSIPTSSDADSSLERINVWLKDCLQNHSACKSPPTTKQPTRLISVGTDGQFQDIKLVDSIENDAPYVALSHCWGTKPLLKTETSTLEQHKQVIVWETLPKTFQDAIKITRSLSLQYLWIDSLCILQDSKLDWQQESAIMGDIYQGCVVSVASVHASKGEDGCFSERKVLLPDGQPTAVESVESGNSTVYARRRLDHSFDSDDLHPLYTRAWTFQERMLAPRILHFGPVEIYWECNTQFSCECGGIERSKKNWKKGSDLEVKRNLDVMMQVIPGSWYPVREWRLIVKEYSQRKLTFPTDRLIALSAIVNQVSSRMNGIYVGGLWHKDLPDDLLWITQSSPSTLDIARLRYGNYRAPTWSWASVDGTVTWLSGFPLFFKYLDLPQLRVVDVECIPEGKDPAGQLSDATLTLFGAMSHVGIYLGNSGSRNEKAWYDELLYVDGAYGCSFRVRKDGPFGLEIDDEQLFTYLSCVPKIFLLYIQGGSFMLIRQASLRPGAFERLGIANFTSNSDSYLLYLQEQFKEESTFTIV